MLDELAQHATRFQAAQSAGGEQLAAFLMRLHGYARDHSGIALVLTLAGSSDAFAKQTKKIADIISKVKGQEVDESQALAMAQNSTFTREEAAYWLSRVTTFGPDENRWAQAGLKIMLGGVPGDSQHTFLSTTTFDHILQTYIFDRKLRLLVMDGVVLRAIAKENELRNDNIEIIDSLKSGDKTLEKESLILKWEKESQELPLPWPEEDERLYVTKEMGDPAWAKEKMAFTKNVNVRFPCPLW